MYARFFNFKVNPSRRSEVETLADQAFGIMKTLKGFVSVHFIVSEDESECGTFSLWETRDDAETAGASLRSRIGEALEKIVNGPPKQQIFEVYKPKS